MALLAGHSCFSRDDEDALLAQAQACHLTLSVPSVPSALPPTCCNPCASLAAGPLLHRYSPSSTCLAHSTAALALPSMFCPRFPCSSLQQDVGRILSDFWTCWELFLRCFIQTLELFRAVFSQEHLGNISPLQGCSGELRELGMFSLEKKRL